MFSWVEKYQTQLSTIFTLENRFRRQIEVEAAFIHGLADPEVKIIPEECASEIDEVLAGLDLSALWKRSQEIEKTTKHDIMAMVKALTEACGDRQVAKFIHFGATSQDVNDTVTALQLVEAKRLVLESVKELLLELAGQAQTHRALVCVGRTHGQHAIPITMGYRLANLAHDILLAARNLERADIAYGKFSGAVGTFALLGSSQRIAQRLALTRLGLKVPAISGQTLSRVWHSSVVDAAATLCAALSRLAGEVRNLQRTEIGELCEGFGAGQVGSSTMPQKRNPISSEQVCGLCRAVRALAQAERETVMLEHERDLTNSSTERVVFSSVFSLTHYCLNKMTKVIRNAVVNADRCQANLDMTGGAVLAERVMGALTAHIGRQTAHEVVKAASHGAGTFKANLAESPVIAGLGETIDLEELLNPAGYIGSAVEMCDEVVELLRVWAKK